MVITTINELKNNGLRAVPHLVSWMGGVVAFALAAPAGAAEWKVEPALGLKETYSDNVKLAPKGAETGDFVTEISPGILVTGTGRNLKFKTSYAMQNIVYADESAYNTIRHQLSADANATLLDDFFFLDGNASISQQNVSAFGPQAVDNTSATNNRADVRTVRLSPYFKHRFENLAVGELRYTHDVVSTSTDGMQSSAADTILLNLNSGTAFQKTGWGTQYIKQSIDYRNARTVELESVTANLAYLVTKKFSLIETIGYEKNDYAATNGTRPEGFFWTSGFSWAPSSRTGIQASMGRHYYGKTYALQLNHRSRNTTWDLGYNESITTARSQLATSGIGAAQVNGGYLVGTMNTTIFSNAVYLQKKLDGSVTLKSAKSDVNLGVFYITRSAQTDTVIDNTLGSIQGTSFATLNQSTRQAGGNATWTWRITGRTRANLGTAVARTRALATNQKQYTGTVSLAVTRQMQPRLDGTVGVRHVRQVSSQAGGDLVESAVSASIRMRF